MTDRKILVTGCRGQLGSDLMRGLSAYYDVSGIDIENADLTDANSVKRAIEKQRPMAVLHTAAFTDVDGCESDRDQAMAVNADGAENVARTCSAIDARMIYYSTDYVFDGEMKLPYVESDIPDPRTVYGQSKLEGERRVETILGDYVVLRLAWLYGEQGGNFVRTIIKKGYEQQRAVQRGEIIEPLKIVDDQIGNPTWTVDVVRQTRTILESDLTGVVHCSSEGETSWYGLGQTVFKYLGMPVQVRPCNSEEYHSPASRPKRSALENRRLHELGLNRMRLWQVALKEFLSGSKEKLFSCHVK
ncbi:MAG: dTDP-4-dehydrorhamnose reductase [candidate division Zixibacteria bacterium]|nr:dTDP-4-dehydrorhamnose reductase [candidate division Zixibacteria bacterium]